MAWERPTLAEIKNRIESDIKSGLGLTTLLRRSFLKVLAKAIAGAVHLLHGFLQYMSKQIFVDTAEVTFLERHGAVWGVFRNAATFAEFTLSLTGVNGSVVPVSTTYVDAAGNEFTTQSEATISGGVATVNVLAQVSGESQNPSVSDVLSLLSPISGVDTDATVSAIVTEAADTESDDDYRARLLAFIRQPPSGGAANDYILWAKSITGITRAWVHPLYLGPGTVGVSIVTDAEDPISASGAKVTEVQNYIDTVKPVDADVTVFTPTLFEIDMVIDILPNTTAVQNAIESELEDLILRDSNVEGSYASPGETNDGVILLSRINEAISIAQGEQDHNIVSIDGVTPADVDPGAGKLAVLGTITWQTLT